MLSIADKKNVTGKTESLALPAEPYRDMPEEVVEMFVEWYSYVRKAAKPKIVKKWVPFYQWLVKIGRIFSDFSGSKFPKFPGEHGPDSLTMLAPTCALIVRVRKCCAVPVRLRF